MHESNGEVMSKKLPVQTNNLSRLKEADSYENSWNGVKVKLKYKGYVFHWHLIFWNHPTAVQFFHGKDQTRLLHEPANRDQEHLSIQFSLILHNYLLCSRTNQTVCHSSQSVSTH